jgi:transcriptional regulator with XRE-family HTH domain
MADTVAGGHSRACENRESIAERRRRAFFEDTQSPADVLRHRIRDERENKGLTQAALAREMTAAGAPLTHDKISKIENGGRSVAVEELFAFAEVLKVTYVHLLSPLDGEPHMRVSGRLALERAEIGNWMVWGDPESENARSAQEFMRLNLEIQFWMQAAKDEPENRKSHERKVADLVRHLSSVSGMRPGVLRRLEVAETMRPRPAQLRQIIHVGSTTSTSNTSGSSPAMTSTTRRFGSPPPR